MTETQEGPTGKQVLDMPMKSNVIDVFTIKEYLIELLHAMYQEEEDFDGECPFGDFDWIKELHLPLLKCGAVKAVVDKGLVMSYDVDKAHEYIFRAINALGQV